MDPRAPRRIQRPGHLALTVPDVERAVDFYTRALRMRVVERQDGVVYLSPGFPHHYLELHPGSPPGVHHFAWETDSDEETEALRRELAAQGIPVEEAPPEPGRKGLAFRFLDSTGMWNEVYRGMERLPVMVSGASYPVLRLGHFTRMTTDPDRDLEFFRRLGFRVSDWLPGTQAFLRCRPEHHNVGFLKYHREQLHHHAYDVGDWNALKAVLDTLAAEGIPAECGPLRHAAGNNICVYVRDPFGIRVEFFCEMEPIEDDEDHLERRQPFVFDLWHQTGPPEGFRD